MKTLLALLAITLCVLAAPQSADAGGFGGFGFQQSFGFHPQQQRCFVPQQRLPSLDLNVRDQFGRQDFRARIQDFDRDGDLDIDVRNFDRGFNRGFSQQRIAPIRNFRSRRGFGVFGGCF